MTPKTTRFLDALSGCGNISKAAEIAGVSRDGHYKRLRRDENYRTEFKKAIERYGDALLQQVRRNAERGAWGRRFKRAL